MNRVYSLPRLQKAKRNVHQTRKALCKCQKKSVKMHLFICWGAHTMSTSLGDLFSVYQVTWHKSGHKKFSSLAIEDIGHPTCVSCPCPQPAPPLQRSPWGHSFQTRHNIPDLNFEDWALAEVYYTLPIRLDCKPKKKLIHQDFGNGRAWPLTRSI